MLASRIMAFPTASEVAAAEISCIRQMLLVRRKEHRQSDIQARFLRCIACHVRRYPFELFQVRNLAANLREVIQSERMNLRARIGVPVDKAEQATDFIEAEAEAPSSRTKLSLLRQSAP